MGKLIVIFLATCAALWAVYFMVGAKLTETAFHVPHFGTAVSWTVVCGGLIGFGIYRIVSGK
jgi:hypothetical protein